VKVSSALTPARPPLSPSPDPSAYAPSSLRPLDAPLLAAPYAGGPATGGTLSLTGIQTAFATAAAATAERSAYEALQTASMTARNNPAISAFAAAATAGPAFSAAASLEPPRGGGGAAGGGAATAGAQLQAFSSFGSSAEAEAEFDRALALLRSGEVRACAAQPLRPPRLPPRRARRPARRPALGASHARPTVVDAISILHPSAFPFRSTPASTS
jgi:hypothetical protein